MSDETTTGWTVAPEWRDGPGPHDMTQVWRIEGPEPFGGLTSATEDQAHSAADMLNRLYDREPPSEAAPEVHEDPVASCLGEAISGEAGVSVTVQGSTITVTVEDLDDRILAQFITAESVRTRSQVYDKVRPCRMAELDDALARLSKAGSLRRTCRVMSPFGGHGIEEYPRVQDVPETMTDDFSDPPREFDVSLADIQILYRRGDQT